MGECFLLEEGLLGSLGSLLGKEGSELTAGAGVGQLAGRLCGTAAVLHVQVVHEQDLENTTASQESGTGPTGAPCQQHIHGALLVHTNPVAAGITIPQGNRRSPS